MPCKKNLLAGLMVALFASTASAFDPFTVKDIRVEGIQRTEAGTVFSYLPIKVGDTMTDEKAAQAIKALFATGFFKDVRIEAEGNTLVVLIEERPAIAAIDFSGLKELDNDQVKQALKGSGIAEGRIFDRATLDRAEQELKRQYLSRGLYAVQITTTVTPLERNRVGISFVVNEGDIAKIRQINIVGANSFREKDLLNELQLDTPSWVSWYTKSDQYSKQKLSADLETLRSYYLNRGFLEFNVDSTQVSISPDKKDIFITISVTEGERFIVSSVKLAGELLLSDDELKKLVKVRPGDVFSRGALNDSIKAVTDRLGALGYAFANVNAAPEVDKEKHQVAFTIFVDPGRRVYVRRINVTGNTKTRDEVVRQEMRQIEGGWYDADKVALSKQRIDKTGYFKEVNVETPPVPGTTDQVDVNVNVEERNTGSISFGAGYSSSEKLILSASLTQSNLFGSGKYLSLDVNTGEINRVISVSYTNPYFTVDGISQGFDVYHRRVDPTSLSVGQYTTKSTGGGIRFGYPISETNAINFGLGIDYTSIDTGTYSPLHYRDFVEKYGHGNLSVPLSAGWSFDGRDSVIYPTSGSVHRANVEASLPIGSLQFYRLTYLYQRYFPLTRDLTLFVSGNAGYGNGYGGKSLPFYRNFYAGGMGSVRGYDTASLGPRGWAWICDDYDESKDPSERNCRWSNDDRIGGNRTLSGTVELYFPMPGFSRDHSVRLGSFIDGGQVWGKDEKMSMADIRYSAGLSVLWSSPFGPLKFSVGFPLNSKEGDKIQRFQFQMGTSF
ncbi:MAG: outer membrane protein assembly factor BamA [Betaproteobacteria bacterium]|nr:outer membrane protein assembly factor BamA [Betaproteobacteria bacterium]